MSLLVVSVSQGPYTKLARLEILRDSIFTLSSLIIVASLKLSDFSSCCTVLAPGKQKYIRLKSIYFLLRVG